MSLKFQPLKVKEIIQETHDANTVVFEKPNEGFNYKPGQYLTLKFDIGGESVRRAYSLCSSPISDADLAVTVKRVENGKVSNYIANSLRGGDTVEVMPPMGNFKVDIDASRAHHYVLLGGGSGITPLMSIIKSVLEVEVNSKLSLIYANKSEADIIFHSALTELQSRFGDRLKVIHSLDQAGDSWTGLKGMLTRMSILSIVQDIMGADSLSKSFWLCGPGGFMEEVQSALGFLGIAKDAINREIFTAPLPDPNKEAKTVSAEPVAGKRGDYTIKVKLDGDEKDVHVKNKTTILEAVLDDGMDPPYACQMGVCCTCRAKVLSGQVEMEEDEGLSDQEIEDGYILTCQSHPLTPDVVIEYG